MLHLNRPIDHVGKHEHAASRLVHLLRSNTSRVLCRVICIIGHKTHHHSSTQRDGIDPQRSEGGHSRRTEKRAFRRMASTLVDRCFRSCYSITEACRDFDERSVMGMWWLGRIQVVEIISTNPDIDGQIHGHARPA